MSKVTIRNRTPRVQSFVLPHRPCCIARGRCRCHAGTPPSILLQPFGLAAGLDEGDLRAPDLVRALRLKIVETVAASAEKRRPRPVAEAPAEVSEDERPARAGGRRRSG